MSTTLQRDATPERTAARPFQRFAESLPAPTTLRTRITEACRRPEPACLPPLIALARQSEPDVARTRALALRLVEALRRRGRQGGAEGLLDEYALSSQEGVALMCLAEALLRIPDAATRDALIRDKIAGGDWQAHLGHSPSLFVNAATWGLVVTGKLVTPTSSAGLAHAITRLIGRGGEPVIRRGVAVAMRLMGEQFVTGQTIGEALAKARTAEARGFRFSFDMLGEAATTAEDADRYYADYDQAIRAIGAAAAGRGIIEGPGISIKLSALHPRYTRAQSGRVRAELLPRLRALALLARSFDIGLNIDAEEADRLELSLDLLEALCLDPALAGWNGVGFVVQAYGRRCPFVIDWLIDLAQRSQRRLMVRLVKGAYWDTEIKRAQVDGLADFPVFTRKLHTDVSYLACARKLLQAPGCIYPQFATHNAQTLAAIHTMAGENYAAGQYEFQCLHGMGEPLYDEVVGPDKLNRPCRIYAPVGTHETLLAYLVRRLLENGANTSFVNRVADPDVQLDDLIADPAATAAALHPIGAPHARIALPRDIFGAERANSAGVDLSDEHSLADLAAALSATAHTLATARPMLAGLAAAGASRPIRNPADHRDLVGTVVDATPDQVAAAVQHAVAAGASWSSTPASSRAACLLRAADALEGRMSGLVGLLVREAGKTFAASISEIREAVDFLRYYAAQVTPGLAGSALGPVVCISPWNFPLAIFTGQIAAALAAGNTVLAKPAEQTPLIAARAVAILHEAGIPADVLHLLPGDGTIGAALVAHCAVCGVVFTGSTDVARAIQRTLAQRLTPSGTPVTLIAETGGQNAMVVDSSALAEQVVADVLASAFDSAGQRCSALRILCLQDDIAARTLRMLHGAMRELAVGNPDRLSIDVGPVIDAAAHDAITAHIAHMRAQHHRITALDLSPETSHGTFVAPTVIEIDRIADVDREVFGPVLHVLRYRRDDLDRLLANINATGYGLTFGLHTRIDETIAHVTDVIGAGNLYINRTTIGAVVGVQPFGGRALSGTGPKAGGPLYLHRLVTPALAAGPLGDAAPHAADPAAVALRDWLIAHGTPALAARCTDYLRRSALHYSRELEGPVGERNSYALHPLGTVVCLPRTPEGAILQIGAALATGNRVLLPSDFRSEMLDTLPSSISQRIERSQDWRGEISVGAVLVEGDAGDIMAVAKILGDRTGPLVRLQAASVTGLRSGAEDYQLEWLLQEQVITVNTAAAGGNASLLAMADR